MPRITPTGKSILPSHLRSLWVPSPSRRHDDGPGAADNPPAHDSLSKTPTDSNLWTRHLHRLADLDRAERRAVRMSISFAAVILVFVGTLLVAVSTFGIQATDQYALVRFL